MLEISFFGVRGSTPCSCPDTAGVGGNTSCVLVEVPGTEPIVLDLGTGLRYAGEHLCGRDEPPTAATALVSHLHWDHIQGLPFFAPVLRAGNHLTFVGPPQETSLAEEIQSFVRPPLFPIELSVLPADVTFVELADGSMPVGEATVTVAPVDHVGATNGYRVDHAGGSVAYLPDHQQPDDFVPAAAVVELCRDVDVLIHDAQYTPEEFVQKATWGHSTPAFALEVALAAGARRLVLFHHDPLHDDAQVEAMAAELRAAVPDGGPEIVVAREGLVLTSGTADLVEPAAPSAVVDREPVAGS